MKQRGFVTASFRVGVSAAKHLALTCINNNLSPAPGCWPVLAHVDFKAEFVWLCASAVASYLFLAILPPSSRQLAWCWLVLEAAFWVFQRTRYGRLLLPVHLYPHTSLYRTLRGSTTPPPVYDHLAVQELKRRFLQLGTNNIFNINQFLNAWFCGASIETIRHGNVAELVAYGFFSLRPAHLTPGQAAEVDAFVLDVQHTFNCTFAPGYNPSLRFLSHLWQPLRVWHKPLALYAAIEGYAALSSLMLQCRGFVRHRHGGFDVYIHLQGCDASSVPIVLLHGVGFGLLPYLPLLSDIQAACPGAPLIVVEAHHVSQRLCITDGARSVDDVASCVLEVLQELGVSQACMVGHSYGSFVVSRLLHMRPEIVHSCVVADPVAMMICYPRLLQAFVYADMSPRLLLSLRGLLRALRLLVSRDAVIAESFGRKFCWRALMLWSEDLPPRSLVAVGGRDDLVPGKMIRASMEACGKGEQVLWLPGAVHGQVVLTQQRASIAAAVQRFVRVCKDE